VELFLVRHGQSEPSTTSPDWDLSAVGAQQALRTARRLAGVQITHLVSSPLRRALATAHRIAEVLDHTPVEVWPDLREGFDADYHGISRADAEDRFPRAAWPSLLPDDGWLYPGDTRAAFQARCQDMLRALTTRFFGEERVVVVVHGGCATYLLNALLGIPATVPCWFELANCGICHVRVDSAHTRTEWPLYPPMDTEVLSINDVAHLTP